MALLSESYRLLANAKINLFLDIENKRSDGYHNILSVFREIKLSDELIIRIKKTPGLELDSEIPYHENILTKTYDLFQKEHGPISGLIVKLNKHIPMGGGLGGGSSNAAVFLKYLYHKFSPVTNKEIWLKTAEQIGSDVPFFLLGGCRIVRGKGELLEAMGPSPMFYVVLVSPGFPISTVESYRKITNVQHRQGLGQFEALVDGIRSKDIVRMAMNMYNVFEKNTFADYPVLEKIKKKLISVGAVNALMSGSGSTMFGIFVNKKKAQLAYDVLSREYPKSYLAQTQ